MALTVTAATLSANEGSAVSASITANIPATATCVWIVWTWDDQGTTDRTYNVTVEGSATNVTQRAQKTESLSGQAFAVHRNFPPSTGAAVAIAISASSAFANRQWRIIVIYAEGGDLTTPESDLQLLESATLTSAGLTITSAVGDKVVSFLSADGRTVGSTGSNEGAVPGFGEYNTSGGVYLGGEDYDGAATVTTGWSWGGSAIIAAEIAFNIKAAGAADPPFRTLLGARRVAA